MSDKDLSQKTTKPVNKKDSGELLPESMGQAVVSPFIQAAVTISGFTKSVPKANILDVVDELSDQITSELKHDRNGGETMLIAQAHTLDVIFNMLAQHAAENMGGDTRAYEVYLRLALKAQSQCRTTWDSIANMKGPTRLGYVKQANIAHGPQQVNNCEKDRN